MTIPETLQEVLENSMLSPETLAAGMGITDEEFRRFQQSPVDCPLAYVLKLASVLHSASVETLLSTILHVSLSTFRPSRPSDQQKANSSANPASQPDPPVDPADPSAQLSPSARSIRQMAHAGQFYNPENPLDTVKDFIGSSYGLPDITENLWLLAYVATTSDNDRYAAPDDREDMLYFIRQLEQCMIALHTLLKDPSSFLTAPSTN